jgi:hypothetical protein
MTVDVATFHVDSSRTFSPRRCLNPPQPSADMLGYEGLPRRAHTIHAANDDHEVDEQNSKPGMCCFEAVVPAPGPHLFLQLPLPAWEAAWKEGSMGSSRSDPSMLWGHVSIFIKLLTHLDFLIALLQLYTCSRVSLTIHHGLGETDLREWVARRGSRGAGLRAQEVYPYRTS